MALEWREQPRRPEPPAGYLHAHRDQGISLCLAESLDHSLARTYHDQVKRLPVSMRQRQSSGCLLLAMENGPEATLAVSHLPLPSGFSRYQSFPPASCANTVPSVIRSNVSGENEG